MRLSYVITNYLASSGVQALACGSHFESYNELEAVTRGVESHFFEVSCFSFKLNSGFTQSV